MSLTRAQWTEMWDSVKKIEVNTTRLKSPPTKQVTLYEVKKIKELIQSVIGQME